MVLNRLLDHLVQEVFSVILMPCELWHLNYQLNLISFPLFL